MLRDTTPAGLPPLAPMPGGGGGTTPPYPPGLYSPYMRRVSPPGSPSTSTSKCCYRTTTQQHQNKETIKHNRDQPTFLCCCCYNTCPEAGGGGNPKNAASALATLAVCALVLGYTILGAFIFTTLEGQQPSDGLGGGSVLERKDPVGDLRTRTVDRLWSITENLNILYRENWTRLAADEVFHFQESLFRVMHSSSASQVPSSASASTYNTNRSAHQHHRWTFSSSFLYSLTLITTIGYGSVSPRTSWGKLATILYALVGIPLMLLYLSTTGDVLARGFRRLYGKLWCSSAGTTDNNVHHRRNNKRAECNACNAPNVRVPVTLCFVMVLAYICSGALLFHRLENWTLLEGSYFCFTSLGTIGFGDLLPGQQQQHRRQEEVSLCACAAYILTGMALVAMCFSLLQDEVLALLRLVGASCAARPPREDSAEFGSS